MKTSPIWALICTPVAPILLISSGHSPRLGGGHAPVCPPVAPDLLRCKRPLILDPHFFSSFSNTNLIVWLNVFFSQKFLNIIIVFKNCIATIELEFSSRTVHLDFNFRKVQIRHNVINGSPLQRHCVASCYITNMSLKFVLRIYAFSLLAIEKCNTSTKI